MHYANRVRLVPPLPTLHDNSRSPIWDDSRQLTPSDLVNYPQKLACARIFRVKNRSCSQPMGNHMSSGLIAIFCCWDRCLLIMHEPPLLLDPNLDADHRHPTGAKPATGTTIADRAHGSDPTRAPNRITSRISS